MVTERYCSKQRRCGREIAQPAREGDVVITLGAGDIYKMGKVKAAWSGDKRDNSQRCFNERYTSIKVGGPVLSYLSRDEEELLRVLNIAREKGASIISRNGTNIIVHDKGQETMTDDENATHELQKTNDSALQKFQEEHRFGVSLLIMRHGLAGLRNFTGTGTMGATSK